MKAYPCIGGPLDGQYATSTDFQQEWRSFQHKNVAILNDPNSPLNIQVTPAGRFSQYQDHYLSYNNSGNGSNFRVKNIPSMVWIHVSLLKPAIPAGKR